MSSASSNLSGLFFFLGLGSDFGGGDKKLSVCVDFKKPKLQILHELSKLIDVLQLDLPIKPNKKKTRARLTNYHDYLRVHAYVRSGESSRSIVTQLYPNNANGLKLVKDYYKAASDLINKASKTNK